MCGFCVIVWVLRFKWVWFSMKSRLRKKIIDRIKIVMWIQEIEIMLLNISVLFS